MTHTATARAALVMTIASGLLALTPPAFAAGEDYVPQARLNVAGTDFTSAQAVAHLKRRLRRTAFAICTADWDGKRLMSTEQRECYDTACMTAWPRSTARAWKRGVRPRRAWPR